MVAHPNRRNLDNRFFIDFDEILVLFPVGIVYPDKQNPKLLLDGFAVDGYTKEGLKISNLLGNNFLFEDRKSGKPDECINFITNYWLKQ
jgi:hypothetical protein